MPHQSLANTNSLVAAATDSCSKKRRAPSTSTRSTVPSWDTAVPVPLATSRCQRALGSYSCLGDEYGSDDRSLLVFPLRLLKSGVDVRQGKMMRDQLLVGPITLGPHQEIEDLANDEWLVHR
jgi:hypothetical protein